jgi:phosphoglycolate phosphatase
MNPLLPTCVLFDLDGTLVDSLPGIEFSVREAFRTCKLPVPKKSLREMIGPPIRTILSRVGNIFDEASLDAVERAFRASYDAEGWRMAVCFPGVDRVLGMMHERRHRLFVVSNKPRQISLQILKRQQIFDYFEAVVTRDSRSPEYQGKHEMIGALLAERVIDEEKCLMVGDTAEDASAAAAAGIQFIWMTHGYGTVGAMSSVPVASTLDGFSQFLPWVIKEPTRD